MTKDDYILLISKMCKTKYGELLVQMMDYYNKLNLYSITHEEVKLYYEKILNQK